MFAVFQGISTLSGTSAFCSVFESQTVVHHILDITPIFGHCYLLLFAIILHCILFDGEKCLFS